MEAWVGLFVALGLVSLFFLAMQVSNLADVRPDSQGYKIFASFENVGGLKVRATVSMAGVRVGRVASIKIDHESYKAIVEMLISDNFNMLPVDTTASILTQGLLGEQYIGLAPGGEAIYLKDGDKIELTQSAMILEEVIGRFLFNKAEDRSESDQASLLSSGSSLEAKAKGCGDGDVIEATESIIRSRKTDTNTSVNGH
jgi:phospholipid/cholesterol/gamma-HCH transport system substrate-binding protein